jgi:hypothetical protein
MKKLLLAGVAALAVLSAPASYAGEVWDFNDYKRCRAAVTFELHPKDDDWISAIPRLAAAVTSLLAEET